jgi:hypothetical protein
MSPLVFVIVFVAGAAANAAWTDARLGSRAPSELRGLLGHAVAAFAFLHLAGVAVSIPPTGATVLLVPLLGVALPALTYTFLVGLWTLKMVRGAVGSATR